MRALLYVNGKVAYEKELRPESEWEIDPVFLEGVGDDSKLRASIEKYFKDEEVSK